MANIVQALINWISLGPLKGYRTYIFCGIQFLLAGAYAINLGGIKQHLNADQMTQIQLLLSGATGLAAATHQLKP